MQFISGKVGGSSHGFMGGTGSRMASACGGICFYMAKLSLPWHGVVRCVLLPGLPPCNKRTLPNSARLTHRFCIHRTNIDFSAQKANIDFSARNLLCLVHTQEVVPFVSYLDDGTKNILQESFGGCRGWR